MPLFRSLSLYFMLTVAGFAGTSVPTTHFLFFGETQRFITAKKAPVPAHPPSDAQKDDRGSRPSASGHIAKVVITDGALTDGEEPQDKDPKKVKKVKKAMHANAGVLGLIPEHLDEMLLLDVRYVPSERIYHYYFQQRYRGFDILNGRLHLKMNLDHNQLEVTNGFFAFHPSAIPKRKNTIDAVAAVRQAVLAAGLAEGPLQWVTGPNQEENLVYVSAPTWSDTPLIVKSALQADSDNHLQLVWDIKGRHRETGHTYHWVVDAADGWVLKTTTINQAPINESFEHNSEAWTASGLWHLVETSEAPCLPVADDPGQLAAYFGDSETCSFATGDRVSGSLTSPVFKSLGKDAWLRFDYLLEVEPYAFQFDLNAVTVLIGDREFALMQLNPIEDATGEWRETPAISLAAFVGQDIQLRFTFDSIDGFNNHYRGWLIDNIVVESNADHE